MESQDAADEARRGQSRMFVLFSTLGAFLMLSMCNPNVGWRYAAAPTSFGERFNVSKTMGLFTTSNQFGQAEVWYRIAAQVCTKHAEYSSQDVVQKAIGQGAAIVAEKSGGRVATGGAALGCQWWEACRNHVKARCTAYKKIAQTGLVAFVLMLSGSLASLMGVIFMYGEKNMKKRDFETAQRSTAIAGMFGFLLPLAGVLMWLFTTQSAFKGLQTTGFYPYPGVHIGAYMAYVALGLLFVAMTFGFQRMAKTSKEDPMAEGLTPPVEDPPAEKASVS